MKYFSPIADQLIDQISPETIIRLRVTGESMRPVIRKGDWVTVRRLPTERYKPGDVLCVKRSEDFVIHRLIKIKKDGWILKGDATRAFDAPVQTKQVIGVVIKVERENRIVYQVSKYQGWIDQVLGIIHNLAGEGINWLRKILLKKR